MNLSRREVLDRHRNEFAMAKDAVSSGRRMNTDISIEVVLGENASMSTLPLIDTSQSVSFAYELYCYCAFVLATLIRFTIYMCTILSFHIPLYVANLVVNSLIVERLRHLKFVFRAR